jgi:probable rRNA maturation factor
MAAMPVDIARRGAGKRVQSRSLQKIAQAILDAMGRAEAELSLALIGNAEMRRLNATYRKKDYPTDVLSFPIEDEQPGVGALIGDVIISVDKAREQALERGHTEAEEIVTLLIHGIVHLLGYDHERSAKDARAMKRQEDKVRLALCERGLLQV